MSHEINIADFAAFCRSKGDESYPWMTATDCALGQYARARFPGADLATGNANGTGIIVDGVRHAIDGLPAAFVYDCRHIPDARGSFAALAARLEALITEPVS